MDYELEFRQQLLSTLKAYFPGPEFVVEIVRSPQIFALVARVHHCDTRRYISHMFDDSVEPPYQADIIRFHVETLAEAVHLELVTHGHSTRVQLWIIDPLVAGPAEIEEIKATIALTGYELRYRERQGLGPGYYLQKAAHTEEIPRSLLTSPIHTWKIHLGQLLDRKIKS